MRGEGKHFPDWSSQEGGKQTASDRTLVVPKAASSFQELGTNLRLLLGWVRCGKNTWRKLMGASSENKVKRLQDLGLWGEGRKGRGEGRGLAESGLLGWMWREETGLKWPP